MRSTSAIEYLFEIPSATLEEYDLDAASQMVSDHRNRTSVTCMLFAALFAQYKNDEAR